MKFKSALCSALLAAGASSTFAQSAWLPRQNELLLTPGFSFSSFKKFWVGRDEMHNPPSGTGESLDQYYAYVFADYGLLPELALDATVGYTWTESKDFGDVNDDGLADTFLGVRYRLIDEFATESPYLPSIAIRVGGVIAGTYEENTPFSPGDGAHGLESSLLLARAIGNTGFGLYGDIGYRLRDAIPDDLFGSAGVFQQLGPVTLNFEYRHVQSLGGSDIGDPGFTFPGLKEITQIVQGGVAYNDRVGRSYQFTVGKSVDGRNTGDRVIFGVNVTIPFGAR